MTHRALVRGADVSDLGKVSAVLGCRPTTGLAEGLAATWSEREPTLAGRP